MLLRDYLFNVLKFSSRLVKRAKEGQILVNGEPKTVRYQLKMDDVLEIHVPIEKSESMHPEKMPLDIVYEDEDVIVVNKLAGIPTIPSRLHPNGTLANSLLYYYKNNHIPYTIHVVTRLDKDTSGLVLIAKHPYSHSLLSSMQQNGKIERKYVAIVHGNLHCESGTIDEPIGRKPNSIIERTVMQTGKRAITHYKRIKQTEQYAVVEVELETGRTHQIRVHFSYLGNPLVGDDLYGGKTGMIKRQALHCSEITFTHPFTKEYITVQSDLPEDLISII